MRMMATEIDKRSLNIQILTSKGKESPSAAIKQKEEEVDDTVLLLGCALARESSPLMIVKEMEDVILNYCSVRQWT